VTRVLAAAGELVLARGSRGVTIAEVARRAHIGKGTVYLYWKTKEDLLLDLVCRDFLALADEITDRRLRAIETLFERHPSGPERLAQLAQRRIGESDDRWVLLAIEFWLHAAGDEALMERFASGHRRMRDRLARLASEDTPLGAESWAIATLALSHGLALERLVDADGVPGDLMTRAQHLLHAGQAA
jgi:AcrR family transcriptional regulator